MTSKDAVRLGMIGCGAIADCFHLPALAQLQDAATTTALVDRSLARLSAVREKFPAAAAYEDYRQLNGKVDGVIVATPPESHFEICRWFLQRGVHVLCEKPLAASYQQAEQLVRLADRAGVHLAVNQTRRLFPTYQKIRELLGQRVLGDLQSIQYHDGTDFDWPAASPHHFAARAKGVWSDTGVHLLDTVCYWLNATPQLLSAQDDSYGGPEALMTVRLRHQQCDIEIKVSRLGRLSNGFRILGSLGSIECEAEEFAKVRVNFVGGRTRVFRCGRRNRAYADFALPLVSNFAASIAGDTTPTISGASTLGTMHLLAEAYDRTRTFPMPWNARLERAVHVAGSDTDAKRLRVLVTGASGCVGGRIVETLAQSHVDQPVAGIRHGSRAARVGRWAVELAVCDICDPHQVDQTVRGVDAIVHCAKTDARSSIVGGTRHLLEAAARCGVERFVFLSTAEVYGTAVQGRIDERTPTVRSDRVYADAKIEAEQLCREFSGQGVAATILRPSLIYGPFSTSWTVDIAKRLQSGNWGLFDQHGEGIANLIYVDDLVQAVVRSLHRPEARNETFNVNGPDTVTWNDYFARFNAALNLPHLKRISSARSQLRSHVTGSLAFLADKVVDRFESRLMDLYLRGGWPTAAMRRIKQELTSTPSGDELNGLFCRDAVYVDHKSRALLGYAPQFDLASGLAHSVAWLAHHELAGAACCLPTGADVASTVLAETTASECTQDVLT